MSEEIVFEDKYVVLSKSHFFSMYLTAFGGDKEEVEAYLTEGSNLPPKIFDKTELPIRQNDTE